MVEGTGLENRHTGNRIEGSNPSPSAYYKKLITGRCKSIWRKHRLLTASS